MPLNGQKCWTTYSKTITREIHPFLGNILEAQQDLWGNTQVHEINIYNPIIWMNSKLYFKSCLFNSSDEMENRRTWSRLIWCTNAGLVYQGKLKNQYPKGVLKLTGSVFLVITRCLCFIVCCLSERNRDPFGHLGLNDRVEERDCQACRIEYSGNLEWGWFCHDLQFLQNPKTPC